MPATIMIAESAAYDSAARSAIFFWIISNDPIGRPNCWRCLAWASATRMMPRVPRTDAAASPSRPEFSTSSAMRNPWPTSPNRSSTGTFTFSKNTARVSEARMPIFSSFLPSVTPVACASTMNAVTRSFRVPLTSTATFANTVKRSA